MTPVATNVTLIKQASWLFSSAWNEQEKVGHQEKAQWPNPESSAEGWQWGKSHTLVGQIQSLQSKYRSINKQSLKKKSYVFGCFWAGEQEEEKERYSSLPNINHYQDEHSRWYPWQLIIFSISIIFCTFIIFYNKWVVSSNQEEGKVSFII